MIFSEDSCKLIYWEDSYSIGNKNIDAEHKKLFEIASSLNKTDLQKNELTKIIKELVKYTKFHFLNEENFMKSISYKGLESHKKLHKKIIEKLNGVIASSNEKRIEEVVYELSNLVNKNILNHILVEDKRVHHSLKTREELKNSFMWKISYKLGNELLDKEHKKLFEIAIKALEYNSSDIKRHVRNTIKELYSYMKTHFEHEEKYMLEISYPKYEEHKKIHNSIIEQMNSFIKTLPNMKINEFEKRLIEYMDIWLVNHILYEDKKITNFLKEKD